MSLALFLRWWYIASTLLPIRMTIWPERVTKRRPWPGYTFSSLKAHVSVRTTTAGDGG